MTTFSAGAGFLSSQSRWRLPVGIALLAVATFLAYLPALDGQFIWDDKAHVTKPELRSLDGLRRIWFDLGATQQYYPLLHSAFWVQCQLWGDHTLGYHLVNVALHLAAVGLVYLILRKLNIPGAWLAAAIFALHPIEVESVAWITEQKNTLSAVFYLSALLVYLRFDETRRPSLYALASALFVLGLLSKTVTATLPAALLVIFWWQRGTLSWRRDVLPLIPWFVLGALAGLMTAWVERKLIGAEGAQFELTFLQRTLLAGRVIWFYLGKLVWPTNLIFIYPRWDVDPTVWWQWLFPLAAVAVLVVLWAVRGRWRGPLAGWLFFVGTLFPVLGYFNVFPFIYSFVADHFQYLAGLGMIVLAASGISLAQARLPQPARWVSTAACVVLLGTLGTLTWRQSRIYDDLVSLYETTIDRNPTCWMAHNNLGMIMARSGRREEAIKCYEAALKLRHQNPEAHNNLGLALTHSGRFDEGLEHLHEALRLRPDFLDIQNNIGNSLAEAGRVPEAIAQFEELLRQQPDYPDAHNNLANLLFRSGRLQEAFEHYRETIRLDPDFAEAHYNLGNALASAGQLPEAIEHYQQSLRLKPDIAEAHGNLGIALAQSDRLPEAIEHYQQALQLKPDYHDCYANLAQAYAKLHRPLEAIATAHKALDLARAVGRTDKIQQIESWLSTYQALLKKNQATPPQPEPNIPPPQPSPQN